MSLHISDIKGTFASFLTEIGLADPAHAEDHYQSLVPLSAEQLLLIECYQTGQIEPSAWQEHLDSDPLLAAHLTLSVVTH